MLFIGINTCISSVYFGNSPSYGLTLVPPQSCGQGHISIGNHRQIKKRKSMKDKLSNEEQSFGVVSPILSEFS